MPDIAISRLTVAVQDSSELRVGVRHGRSPHLPTWNADCRRSCARIDTRLARAALIVWLRVRVMFSNRVARFCCQGPGCRLGAQTLALSRGLVGNLRVMRTIGQPLGCTCSTIPELGGGRITKRPPAHELAQLHDRDALWWKH